MSKLVRLYPRDPERGWFIQTYVDPFIGLKFVASQGWYIVEDEIADALNDVRQKDYDPRSGPAFLIAADKAEALHIEKTVLVPPEKEEDRIGTADDPVPAKRTMRPGSRELKSKAKARKRVTRSSSS